MCSPSGEGCDQAALDGTAVSTLLVGNLTLVSLSHAQQQQQGDPFAPPPPDASQSSLAVLLPIGGAPRGAPRVRRLLAPPPRTPSLVLVRAQRPD